MPGFGLRRRSVLGPVLWNILHDDLLEMVLLMVVEKVTTVAFADDLAIIISANDVDKLNFKVKAPIDSIEGWIDRNRLQVAPRKTEVIIFIRVEKAKC